jgi:hypothetical protein
MIQYKTQSSLHFLSIHAIHLSFECSYGAVDLERTYHCIQGEFMYCGLVTDGQILVLEEDMDELLAVLDLKVFKVEGTSMFVHSGEACLAVPLYVKHISTEHIEEDDEEDEEMIFLPIRKKGSILMKAKEDRTMELVLQHLHEREDLGFA